MMKISERTKTMWSRVQRIGVMSRSCPLDGDKSPAESGENSPHSKSSRQQRPPG